MGNIVTVRGLTKAFGKHVVLKGIDFSVEEGDVVALIGPSGSGKTTLLRCLNLLEQPDAGTISIDGLSADFSAITGKQKLALRRKTAMVFQNYALFLNKTVVQNVMEGLLISKRMQKDEAREVAQRFLTRVGLAEKFDAKPYELSGGQAQRVGIARALALNPKVILFDEPTSALDPEMVDGILDVIKDVAESGVTMVIVTHEMRFAHDIATHVVFLENGEVVEEGTRSEVFDNPREERTQQFLSRFNLGRSTEYFI